MCGGVPLPLEPAFSGIRVFEQAQDCPSQRLGLAGRNHQAILLVNAKVAHPARVGHHHRRAAGHRLARGQAKALVDGRKSQHLGSAIERGQIGVGHAAEHAPDLDRREHAGTQQDGTLAPR